MNCPQCKYFSPKVDEKNRLAPQCAKYNLLTTEARKKDGVCEAGKNGELK